MPDCDGFDWDKGNAEKNWLRHHVTSLECEQVFFNKPLVVVSDEAHSHGENRFYALGQSDMGRLLFVVYCVRKRLIRVISARGMTRREREAYASHEEKDS